MGTTLSKIIPIGLSLFSAVICELLTQNFAGRLFLLLRRKRCNLSFLRIRCTAARRIFTRFFQCDTTTSTCRTIRVPEILENIISHLGSPHLLRYKRVSGHWKDTIDGSPLLQYDLWNSRIERHELLPQLTKRDRRPDEVPLEFTSAWCRACWKKHGVLDEQHLNTILAEIAAYEAPLSLTARVAMPQFLTHSRCCWSLQDDRSVVFSFNSPFGLPEIRGDLDLDTASWRSMLAIVLPVTRVTVSSGITRFRFRFWKPYDCFRVLENPEGVRVGAVFDAIMDLRTWSPFENAGEVMATVLWCILIIAPFIALVDVLAIPFWKSCIYVFQLSFTLPLVLPNFFRFIGQ